MNITPLDVRRKEFDKVFRGYDPTEVDLFLKQVGDRLEEVQEDARRAEEKTREAESKLVHYEKVELALQEALESARESARRSEASAEEKARLIVQEAELRAEQIVHDAERERYGLRQDVSKLSARQAEIAARLRGFLFSELEVLAQFQGDDPVGFIKLQPAGGAPQATLAPPPARLEAPISNMEDTPDEPDARPEPAHELPAPPEPDSSEPSFSAPAAPKSPEPSPAAESSPEPLAAPSASAAPEDEAESEPPAPPADTHDSPEPADAPPSPPAEKPTPPAVTGGWDLRSLVTGEDRNVAGSDQEREAIKRILDDLD